MVGCVPSFLKILNWPLQLFFKFGQQKWLWVSWIYVFQSARHICLIGCSYMVAWTYLVTLYAWQKQTSLWLIELYMWSTYMYISSFGWFSYLKWGKSIRLAILPGWSFRFTLRQISFGNICWANLLWQIPRTKWLWLEPFFCSSFSVDFHFSLSR